MKKYILIVSLLLLTATSQTQIPVEIFGGDERTTLDIMFFTFFQKKEGGKSPWLFFNRNRASLDYRMTSKEYLPQFGFTEAVSYNHPQLKGFAPVVVIQLLNRGIYPKAGIQYALVRKQLTLFSWLVAETRKESLLDYFLLFRYTPPLTDRWQLFTQLETLNSFPSNTADNFGFLQRIRLGLGIQKWQFGVGADFNQSGRRNYTFMKNMGCFLRHEF